MVTLLGRNGAGRTTALRAIMGLTGRRTGSIRIGGHETVGISTHKIAHYGVGYCPEERGIFSSLSCEENLFLPPLVGNAKDAMLIDEIYSMFANLKERRSSQGTRLSGGEQHIPYINIGAGADNLTNEQCTPYTVFTTRTTPWRSPTGHRLGGERSRAVRRGSS